MPTTIRFPDTAKVKIFSDAGKLRASPCVRGSLCMPNCVGRMCGWGRVRRSADVFIVSSGTEREYATVYYNVASSLILPLLSNFFNLFLFFPSSLLLLTKCAHGRPTRP